MSNVEPHTFSPIPLRHSALTSGAALTLALRCNVAVPTADPLGTLHGEDALPHSPLPSSSYFHCLAFALLISAQPKPLLSDSPIIPGLLTRNQLSYHTEIPHLNYDSVPTIPLTPLSFIYLILN